MNNIEKSTTSLIIILALIFFITFSGMNGLWLIDVSNSALINGNILTNGFFDVDPMKAFHIGLYMIDISIILSCILGIISICFIVMYYGIGSPYRSDRGR